MAGYASVCVEGHVGVLRIVVMLSPFLLNERTEHVGGCIDGGQEFREPSKRDSGRHVDSGATKFAELIAQQRSIFWPDCNHVAPSHYSINLTNSVVDLAKGHIGNPDDSGYI